MIKINDIYKPVFETNKRYILLTGGRGSGKSFFITTFLSLLSLDQAQRILFTRYTMTSAFISIIPEFIDKLEKLGIEKKYSINKTAITNIINFNEIMFKGIKTSSGVQTAQLKSIANVSTWCNDESEELTDENTFDTIDLSIRTKLAPNRVILVMNPSNKSHWIYQRFIKDNHRIEYYCGVPVEISTHPKVLHIHTTYQDNLDNLDADFIDMVNSMQLERENVFNHKIAGQWIDTIEGQVFEPSKLKRFSKSELLMQNYELGLAYIDVADEGGDSLACICAQIIGNKVYIVDIVFSQQNTDVTIPLCSNALKTNQIRYCRVESNNMGAMFGRNLQSETKGTQILFATATTNKFARIINESVSILDNFYFLNEKESSPMYQAALNQLLTFTMDGKAKNDDVADAMSGLMIFIRGTLPTKFA